MAYFYYMRYPNRLISPHRVRRASWRLGALILVIGVFCAGQGAWAVDYTTEVCGDGIDNDNSGGAGYGASLTSLSAGDTACSGFLDLDHDGYTTTDCDDTDRNIFPGLFTTNGCTGGQFRKCQTNGTYTACSATYTCEATGSGACYFIDVATGSDSNTGVDTAHAWASFQPITDGCPSGTCHDLVAGDVVLVRAGTYNTNAVATYCGNGNHILCSRNNDGTSSAWVTIRAYPGEAPVIASPNTSASEGAAFELYQTGYWRIEGLTFQGGYGDGIHIEEGDAGKAFQVVHNYFKGVRGVSATNVAAVKNTSTDNVEVANNIFEDTQDGSGGGEQVGSHFVGFGGTSHVHHNIMFTDDQTKRQHAVWYKHGSATGAFEADHNIIWGFQATGYAALGSAQRGSLIHHNLILDSDAGGIDASGDLGGPGYLDNGWNIYNNTIIRSKISYKLGGVNSADATGVVNFANNVISDDSASYSQDAALFTVGVYEDDAAYALYQGGVLASDSNCYYNSALAALTNGFCLLCGSPGTTGAAYDFAGWKAVHDAASYNEDPTLVAGSYVATSANCTGRGWLTLSSATPSGMSGRSMLRRK